jgi:hypothetical protein
MKLLPFILVLTFVFPAVGQTTRPKDEASRAGAKLRIKMASAAALKAAGGGAVCKTTFGVERGSPAHTFTILAKDKHLKQVTVDAAAHNVLSVKDEAEILACWLFDEVLTSKLPADWVVRQNHPTKALAVWGVFAAPSAPTPPNVLNVQTENANATYNMVLAQGTSFADLDLRVDIRGNTGKLDQGGGLIWRAKDENNYYICRINPLEPNYRVYKVENGKRTQLQSADVKTETGQWYTLRAVMVGNHITCYLDDQKLLDVKDDTFKEAGMVGLWTKADAGSSFDNLIVLKPPTGATAPAK